MLFVFATSVAVPLVPPKAAASFAQHRLLFGGTLSIVSYPPSIKPDNHSHIDTRLVWIDGECADTVGGTGYTVNGVDRVRPRTVPRPHVPALPLSGGCLFSQTCAELMSAEYSWVGGCSNTFTSARCPKSCNSCPACADGINNCALYMQYYSCSTSCAAVARHPAAQAAKAPPPPGAPTAPSTQRPPRRWPSAFSHNLRSSFASPRAPQELHADHLHQVVRHLQQRADAADDRADASAYDRARADGHRRANGHAGLHHLPQREARASRQHGQRCVRRDARGRRADVRGDVPDGSRHVRVAQRRRREPLLGGLDGVARPD
eukprot:5894635-Prymnesium_polylepis.1